MNERDRHTDQETVASIPIGEIAFQRRRLKMQWIYTTRETGNYADVKLYAVSQKKETLPLSISLLNIDRFSQFFHRRIQLELCNKIINKDPTAPQMCC